MPVVSRRAFISANAAMAVVASSNRLSAEGATSPRKVEARSKAGAFSVFLSGERVIAMIRSASRAPIPVVFDTGSSGNAIDIGIAKSLGLKRVPHHIVKVVDGATGKGFDASDYIMPEISIGGMSIGDRQVSGYPWVEDSAAGIFGPDLFSGQMMLLDLTATRVRVFDKAGFITPAHAPSPYLGAKGDGVPAVEILLPSRNGGDPAFTVVGKLDSGNNSALKLPADYVDRLPLMRPPTIMGRTTSVSGSRDVMGGQIKGTVKIASIALRDPEVIFDGLTPNVGLPVVRQLRILLDPAAQQGWLLEKTVLPAAALSDYVGEYGIRRVTLRDQQLVYQRQGRPELPLVPLGCDIFDVEDSPNQLWFERIDGRVTRMNSINNANQVTGYDREP